MNWEVIHQVVIQQKENWFPEAKQKSISWGRMWSTMSYEAERPNKLKTENYLIDLILYRSN